MSPESSTSRSAPRLLRADEEAEAVGHEIWTEANDGLHLEPNLDSNGLQEHPAGTMNNGAPDGDAQLPVYTSPKKYTMGQRSVKAFVNSAQLQGHLAILHAFHALRMAMEQGADERIPAFVQRMDPAGRWGWFVNLAVERFERWCLTLEEDDVVLDHLPPIDVVMVWHSYLLNPNKYAEDTTRVRQLGRLTKYTEDMEMFLALPDLLTTDNPTPERVQSWIQRTRTPYAPANAIAEMTHKYVQCPLCFAHVTVPFITSRGTGYAQSKFGHECDCSYQITKESLGLTKLARNIVKTGAPDKYLARTVMTPTSLIDKRFATHIKDRVLAAMPVQQALSQAPRLDGHDVDNYTRQILLNVDYSVKKFHAAMHSQVLHLLSVCSPPLGSFIEKMHDLEWIRPGFFDAQEDQLRRFLGLMAESPASFFVPTLDIDLAWHTHQLMAKAYQKNCIKYIKRYVDHNDKVEENRLANSFDVTCRVWQDKYHVPYMHCGCPLPGDTLGQKLKRLVNRHAPPEAEALLPTDTPLALAATHPSEHNAVFPLHRKSSSMLGRRHREEKFARRVRKAAQSNDSGSRGEPWAQSRARAPTHSQASLYPVPMYYWMPGGRVAGTGGVVTGPTASSGRLAGALPRVQLVLGHVQLVPLAEAVLQHVVEEVQVQEVQVQEVQVEEVQAEEFGGGIACGGGGGGGGGAAAAACGGGSSSGGGGGGGGCGGGGGGGGGCGGGGGPGGGGTC
ncbi:hypothetical protein CONPUDRAFT_158469 [Coniophora puteana RWD-64-598 SS2]|uniref:Uncharacterized protein n=1 Tax=Coniophora puteana (strain RWD-64-598) TaxID=741705 RepID=A0A5M3MCS5_CONPW|nr:uncharacterized protein CONPUDRAFT_158469 [Coniophora puteana RWD-64-598 SS2]EIW76441.1 hypothetical protein CONPUDRAFT_158469 [Coniophora puteana RWD-64-598 SS2]